MQCFKFLKTMMILFNLLIFLCGVALLAVGIWVSVDGSSFLKIFGPLSSSAMQFVNVGYFLIAAGAVLLALGFLGCYGAQTESKCILMMVHQTQLHRPMTEAQWPLTLDLRPWESPNPTQESFCPVFTQGDGDGVGVGDGTRLGIRRAQKIVFLKHRPVPPPQFFSILLVIFIAEVAAAVVALVYTSMAEEFLTLLVVPAIKKDYGQQSDFSQVWNTTMEGLKCCGFTNYTDFEDSPYFNEYHVFPPYCCQDYSTASVPCTREKAEADHVEGCFKQLLHDIRTNAVTVGGVAAGIGGLELAAMIVSMYLYCNMD